MKKIILVVLGVIPLLLLAQKVERKIIGSGETLKIGAGKGGISSTVIGGVGISGEGENPTNIVISFEGGVSGNVLGTNLIHGFTTGAQYGSAAGILQIQSNGVTVTGTVSMVISTATAARGTRSMQVDAAVDNVQVLLTLGTSNLVMSYGMAIRLDSGWSGATFSSYNLADYHSQDGAEYTTVNLFDASPFQFGTQTQEGLSSPINVVTTDINKWLWVTVKWDGSGGSTNASTIRMYQYTGSGTLGTEYPTSPKMLNFTSTPKYPFAFLFGRPDNHDVFNPGATWYIDDVTLRWDGQFPVLPP